MTAAARVSTWDWIGLVAVVWFLPAWYVARVEFERWRERRRRKRRGGNIDLRAR